MTKRDKKLDRSKTKKAIDLKVKYLTDVPSSPSSSISWYKS